LKKAGIAYPSITKGRSRVIPLGKVDMSKVELVHSKSVESSPFLFQALPKSYTDYFKSNIESACSKIADATVEAYRSRSDRPDNTSEVASTASNSSLSMSDNESDDNSSPELSINPRLDDAVMINLDERSDYSSVNDSHQESCGPSLSIEEALTPLSEPRLLTLSSKPYTVVHVNAAFTRMTGMKSDYVVGNSLWKILAPSSHSTTATTSSSTGPTSNPTSSPTSSNEKLCLESCAAGDEINISILQGGQPANAQNTEEYPSLVPAMEQQPLVPEKGAMKCTMRVMPIVSSNNLTHYAVDVLYEDNRGSSHCHLQAQVVG